MKKRCRWLAGIFLLILLLLPVQPGKVQAAALKQPVLVKVTSVSYNTLKVQWKKVSGASGYRVYRKSGTSGYKQIAAVKGAGKVQYSDKTVKTGTKYTYTVRAYKGSALSGFDSRGVSGTAQLGKPAVKSVSAGGSGQLTVQWGKVDGASGYVVYRALGADGKFAAVKTLGANILSYTDTGLESGKTYYYEIRAYRTVDGKNVYSAYSAKKGKKVSEEAMSFEAFAKAVAELIKKYDIDLGNIGDIVDEFFSKRLIVKVKSDDISFDKYHPLVVLKGPEHICLLQFATEEETKKALQELKNSALVQYAEADGVSTASAATAGAASQHKSWGVSRMNADGYAEYTASVTNSSIKVAVVDTGVSSHPFLSGRIASGGYDFVGVDSDPSDQNGHGTHVSGTIVDCTPGLNVKILPVRVLDKNGSGYMSVVASGIRYAADNGAKVINLSLGGWHSSLIDEMVSYAVKKGVTVVAAAGNEGVSASMFCPSHISSAIVVGAVDSQNSRAYFSNTGSPLDVVAPGVDIVSCIPGGGYASYSGTSMAAPHVSAIAAMFKLVYPSRTPAQIEEMIRKNTQDLGSSGWDSSYGCGIPKLNSHKQPEKVVLNQTSASLKVGDKLTLKASVQPGSAKQNVTWSSSNASVASVSGGVVTARAAGTANITAATGNGKKAVCKITVKQNVVPVTGITLNRTSASLVVGNTVTLSASVSPSNATDKTVTWSSSDAGIASVKKGVVTANSAGTATITAAAGNGKKASCTVTVTASQVGIELDKGYYTCKEGKELIIEAEITLPEKVTLNQKKYILYVADMGYGWQQLGAYNVGGTKAYLEPRVKGKTKLYSCLPKGNRLIIKMGIDTTGMKASVLAKMLKLAIFPYNDFNPGKSMHDEIFLLSVQ